MQDSTSPKGRRKGWKIALVAAICLVVVGGGVGAAATAGTWLGTGNGAPPPAPASVTPTRTLPPVEPVALTVTPKNDATFINPADPVVARADHGTLTHVVLKVTDTGESLDGELSADGATWKAKDRLAFDTNYTFDITAEDANGVPVTRRSTFSTVPPSNEANAFVYPNGDFTVGVGQPLEFTFSEPVTNKAAVEKAIRITAGSGQKGAFRWYSDTMARYRPAEFWAANTKIKVDMDLFGVDFGNGQIGNFSNSTTIQVGNKVELVADAANHVADVYINGALARHFLVTMGDERFPSASGYLVLLNDKQRKAHFVASTIGLKPGDPADYGEVDVNYATRLTPSGEFIHQATDSAVPFIGQVNLSHGCIGMDAAGASWVFQNMGPGDLVHVVNSPAETIAPTDGFGDWNIPFNQYASR
ncbi:L,D-transpeptidase [Specibacter cremeus]|uniref:L,D-transpeptidase n=1 Tax=Specibacter cremeus TaxID=1629051 RepID=UPI000F7880F2|nr:Ig-like domain-containing protein [Specibacter cremeus]